MKSVYKTFIMSYHQFHKEVDFISASVFKKDYLPIFFNVSRIVSLNAGISVATFFVGDNCVAHMLENILKMTFYVKSTYFLS